jgi:Domain of unknown function (DUF4340)
MNEMLKTLSLVAVALALTGAAFVSTRDRTRIDAEFDDQGKMFFPDFKDPLACTDLEVVEFESTTATASRFRVMFKDKKWVIPSHYNYPADARDRLSKTAAAIIDLTKDTIRSNSAEDQEAMGVIDPLDSKVSTLKGRGKRITLRDETEKVLADIVIGNDIKGGERKDGSAQHYVRVPGQKRIYGVNIKAEPSVRFADWIETNLLKVEAGKIRTVTFDNYKIKEIVLSDGRPGLGIERGEKSTITRKDSTGPWTMEGIPAGQELSEDKLRSLTDALGDLKIVGIRPRPAGLKNLDQENLQINNLVRASLQNKGFFIAPQQGLISDQGDVLVGSDEGVIYTLRYGGPVFSEGEELTRGEADDVEKKSDAPKDKKDADKKGTQENRYLMVTVRFDPALIAKPESMVPKPAAKPAAGPVDLPANVFAPDFNDPKYQAEQKEAKEKADREKADYDKKIADGEKRVKELSDRFSAWYYVTTSDSFRSINLDRTLLLQPKKATPPGQSPGGLDMGVPPIKP